MAKRINASSGRMPTRIAALTFGIAIGITAGVYFMPTEQKTELNDARNQLEQTTQQLQLATERNAANEAYIGASGQIIVANRLFQVPVLKIIAPDAYADDIAAVEGLLAQAGSADAGSIFLSPEFFAQDSADQLNNIVTAVLPAGRQLSTTKIDPGTHSGEILGAAMSPITPDNERALVLNALQASGFISQESQIIIPTNIVLFITGDSVQSGYSAAAISSFAQGLADQGSQVVYASRIYSAADSAPMDLLRRSIDPGPRPSTVDDLSSPVGRIATVLAVAEQSRGGSGAYGIAATASAVSPPFVLS